MSHDHWVLYYCLEHNPHFKNPKEHKGKEIYVTPRKLNTLHQLPAFAFLNQGEAECAVPMFIDFTIKQLKQKLVDSISKRARMEVDEEHLTSLIAKMME